MGIYGPGKPVLRHFLSKVSRNRSFLFLRAGAEESAIVYSLSETAKANKLKPYDYFEYLLTEIPKHMDDTDRSFLEDLLPWSPKLPDNCRKNNQEKQPN